MAVPLSIDVEMAEVADSSQKLGTKRIPIKVSLVDYNCNTVYDAYVKLPEGTRVVDFKTHIHGISPQLVLAKGQDYNTVRKEVEELLKNNIVVGHSVMCDLISFDFLDLVRNNKFDLRCTATASFLKKSNGGSMKLKDLASKFLDITMHEGQGSHDSAEDAKVAMLLYKKFENKPLRSWGDALREEEINKIKRERRTQRKFY